MTVRRAAADDAEALAEIDLLSNPGPWSAHSFAEAAAGEYTVLLAAESGETLCGFLAGEIQGDILAVDEIAVKPEYRRQGYAKALLSAAEDLAAVRGCVSACLEVRSRNEGAIAFYEDAGFRKAGIRKRLYRDPDDDGIVMTRLLAD